jgi:hypothetical protein
MLITITVTRHFHQKRQVSLCVFAENARYDLKICSLKDNAEFHLAFLGTALSLATPFRQKKGVIETFEYLGKFEKYLRWLYCVGYLLVTECKKKLKNRL